MRVLVVGKGAVGGYFGGRLHDSGADVTFLVRRKTDDLQVQSVHGDMTLKIKSIVSGEQVEPFDLIIMSTKAYHLKQAIEDIAPYVGENTTVLPLLNGYYHLAQLQERFPHVLGGLCFIESTIGPNGEIIQTSKRHDIIFGEIDGQKSDKAQKISDLFSKAQFKSVLTDDVKTAMWNKYVFITALSGITTIMYTSMGSIQESPYGTELFRDLLAEINAVAETEGVQVYSPEKNVEIATAMGPKMKASMLRDMEKGLPTEADHLQGELMKLAEKHGISVPLLKMTYNRLRIYEVERLG
ncbi:ketopantoate reductase family protein [Ammoniphilus resinae]|uniref:2-dehydropantoate 2-reductase n=1 Tax=Ammoniphilus resinae TaxID=861532 RepID=A0ABS4GJ02_9BACL|nr:ketopantoate reductase family protein [Ammoniphilus resinae]MBP1930236.1 2-dehydropantoate 2-reductase [Ammoniphilus resinae]